MTPLRRWSLLLAARLRNRGCRRLRREPRPQFRPAIVFIPVLLLLVACTEEPPPPAPLPTPTAAPLTLRLGVVDAAAGLDTLVSEPYAAVTDRARLQFVPANDAALLADVAAGQLDAAFVHELPPGTELWYSPVALDGVVVLIHPDNPVEGLSTAQLQGLFSGQIGSWAGVSGPEEPVVPIIRESGAGSRAIFARRVMGAQRVTINALVAPTYEAAEELVAETPGGIAYGMLGAAAGQNVVAVDGVAPTPATVAEQRYPLTAPLYVVSGGEPAGELRAFIAWLQGPEGQALLGDRYGRVR